MQVETYEVPEVANEPLEACEEAIGLVRSLGLEGQQRLVTKQGERETRFPYRVMTEEEDFVFSVLCPVKVKVEDYGRLPMPLRVLQVLAYAKEAGGFTEFQVWDTRSVSEKDPVLVGLKPDPESTWRKQEYLLARWGEELESWPVLLKRAVLRKREEIASAYRSLASKVQAAIMAWKEVSPEEIVRKAADFGVGYVNS